MSNIQSEYDNLLRRHIINGHISDCEILGSNTHDIKERIIQQLCSAVVESFMLELEPKIKEAASAILNKESELSK